MDIATSIKSLRERHNMTQEQFGKIAGVSSMAVSQWENGRSVPRMGAIQKMSDFFGIPKSEIIGDNPNDPVIKSFDNYEAYFRNDWSQDEYELMQLFKKMDPQCRDHLLQTARMCAALSEKDGQVNERIVNFRTMDAMS